MQTPTSALEYEDGVIDLCGPVGEDESGVLDTIRPAAGEDRTALLARHALERSSWPESVETAEGWALEFEVMPRHDPIGSADLVGIAEIAARAGVAKATVMSWRRRHRDFPAPVVVLAGGPVWDFRAVDAWRAGLREGRPRKG